MKVKGISEVESAVSMIANYIKDGDAESAVRLVEASNMYRKHLGLGEITKGDIMFYLIAYDESKEIPENKSRLYVIEFEDGIVKIGVSKNPKSRFKTLENSRGFKTTRRAVSAWHTDAFQIESKLKKLFLDNKLEGEYFNADFEEILRTARKECLILEEGMKEVD